MVDAGFFLSFFYDTATTIFCYLRSKNERKCNCLPFKVIALLLFKIDSYFQEKLLRSRVHWP